MKARSLSVFLSLALVLTFTSCGQSESGGEAADQGNENLSPADLGTKIAQVYTEAIEELSAAIKDKPQASDIIDDVKAMKERYIQKLVALGRQREAMPESDRSTVDSKISSGLNSMYNKPAFNTYMEATNHYMSQDAALHKELSDFNILTQYASFDLLKQQAPAEAARLGIQ